jgi:hypothetical protein
VSGISNQNLVGASRKISKYVISHASLHCHQWNIQQDPQGSVQLISILPSAITVAVHIILENIHKKRRIGCNKNVFNVAAVVFIQ